MTKKNFAIVGAGIAGLTLASALHRKGFAVTVYENAPAIKALGAGLTLAGNAVKALLEIGIGEAILREGKVMRSICIKDSKGSVLATTDAERLSQKFGVINNFAIHRSDLHRALLLQFPSEYVKLNKGCADITQSPGGVTLTFNDGTQAIHDYVIACDGIHSVIRKKLLPGSQPRYAGYTCWRSVIDTLPEGIDTNETSEYWGKGSRFGVVPLTNGRIYWFACLNAEINDSSMRRFSVIDLLFHFGKYAAPIPQILKATHTDQLIWGDIFDLTPISKFAFGKIVLVGDAAHATTPNLGQGACMAIEDAAVLANCIEKCDLPEEAFVQFEQKRIKRTTRIVNSSRTVGEIAQVENGLLATLRNSALRLTPSTVAEKQIKFLMDVSFH